MKERYIKSAVLCLQPCNCLLFLRAINLCTCRAWARDFHLRGCAYCYYSLWHECINAVVTHETALCELHILSHVLSSKHRTILNFNFLILLCDERVPLTGFCSHYWFRAINYNETYHHQLMPFRRGEQHSSLHSAFVLTAPRQADF